MSEALRLADELQRVAKWSDSEHWDTLAQAAAELRRLHAENEALKAELLEQARVNGMGGERELRLMALNAELVEALHQIRAHTLYSPTGAVHLIARAALAKIGGSK